MSDVEIYLYSSCTSCRKADELLNELGVEADRRDYFRRRFSRDELVGLLDRIVAGLRERILDGSKRSVMHFEFIPIKR